MRNTIFFIIFFAFSRCLTLTKVKKFKQELLKVPDDLDGMHDFTQINSFSGYPKIVL